MGFIKSNIKVEEVKIDNPYEVLLNENEDIDKRLKATRMVDILSVLDVETKALIDEIIFNHTFDKKNIDKYKKILDSNSAYARNRLIEFLQNVNELECVIDELLKDSRDLKIFALNILGDGKLDVNKTKEIVINVLKNENDVNVISTALDVFRDLVDSNDVELLNSVKNRFNNEFLNFSIDMILREI